MSIRSLLSEELIEAVKQNDLQQLQRLRSAGKTFSSCDEDNNTLLHVTVKQEENKNSLEVLDYLLSVEEISKNSKNTSQVTPLMEAFDCEWHSQSYIFALMESGCDIFARWEDERTLLHRAIKNEWNEVAEFLIESGLDIDRRTSTGETPLFLACENGLVDEIWMLLFYGANPNTAKQSEFLDEKVTCFDLAARSGNPEIQAIFFEHLIGYNKNVSLNTFVKSVKHEAIPFSKLLEGVSHINVNNLHVPHFFCAISDHPEYFQLFKEKFDDLVDSILQCCEMALMDPDCHENLHTFTKTTLWLFESPIGATFIDQINLEGSFIINYIIDTLDDTPSSLEATTQLFCCMLSHGVNLNTQAVHQIYLKFGYCDLFKIFLHMDFSEASNFDFIRSDSLDIEPNVNFSITFSSDLEVHKNFVMPRIIYDVNMTVPTSFKPLVTILAEQEDSDLIKNIVKVVFAYFALPQFIKESIFKLNQCKDLFDSEEYEMFMDSEKCPEVPMLVELCRNRAREYIIQKYGAKNSRQFYTVLSAFPIPAVYKRIISFEKRLYPLNRSC